MKLRFEKLNISVLLDLITFTFFMKPLLFGEIKALDLIFDVGRVVFLLITIIRYIRFGRLSYFAVAVAAYEFVLLLSTLYHHGSLTVYAPEKRSV